MVQLQGMFGLMKGVCLCLKIQECSDEMMHPGLMTDLKSKFDTFVGTEGFKKSVLFLHLIHVARTMFATILELSGTVAYLNIRNLSRCGFCVLFLVSVCHIIPCLSCDPAMCLVMFSCSPLC